MKTIVFCDFDGTITVKETFEAMLRHFAPEVSEQLIPQMYARKLTIRDGVRQIMATIPSSRYPEIVEFTRGQPMRAGLIELLDFLDDRNVPLVVVSGGLRGMVEVVLGELVNRVRNIHAMDIDISGEYLNVISKYEGDTELVAKVQVIAEYDVEKPVAIGDSLTDLNMALYAPIVFARDRLAKYLDEHQKSYIPWHDFFDVREYLAKLWD